MLQGFKNNSKKFENFYSNTVTLIKLHSQAVHSSMLTYKHTILILFIRSSIRQFIDNIEYMAESAPINTEKCNI